MTFSDENTDSSDEEDGKTARQWGPPFKRGGGRLPDRNLNFLGRIRLNESVTFNHTPLLLLHNKAIPLVL